MSDRLRDKEKLIRIVESGQQGQDSGSWRTGRIAGAEEDVQI